jgi:hypothetical protein
MKQEFDCANYWKRYVAYGSWDDRLELATTVETAGFHWDAAGEFVLA